MCILFTYAYDMNIFQTHSIKFKNILYESCEFYISNIITQITFYNHNRLTFDYILLLSHVMNQNTWNYKKIDVNRSLKVINVFLPTFLNGD